MCSCTVAGAARVIAAQQQQRQASALAAAGSFSTGGLLRPARQLLGLPIRHLSYQAPLRVNIRIAQKATMWSSGANIGGPWLHECHPAVQCCRHSHAAAVIKSAARLNRAGIEDLLGHLFVASFCVQYCCTGSGLDAMVSHVACSSAPLQATACL